jgi:hypothetical protein
MQRAIERLDDVEIESVAVVKPAGDEGFQSRANERNSSGRAAGNGVSSKFYDSHDELMRAYPFNLIQMTSTEQVLQRVYVT